MDQKIQHEQQKKKKAKIVIDAVPCIVDGNRPIPILKIWHNSIINWTWIATSKPYPETDPNCYYGFVFGLANEWGTFNKNWVETAMSARQVQKSQWDKFDFIAWADPDKLEEGV